MSSVIKSLVAFSLMIIVGSAHGGENGTKSPKLPDKLATAPANTWVKIAGAPGPRSSFGLIYVPSEKAFVCFGGSMAMDLRISKKAANSPYSELTLNMEKGVWENRFPKGKEGAWGPRVGPSKAPAFKGSYYAFNMKDAEGNARPYLGGGYYNAAWLWGNYAHDTDRGKVVMYWTLAHRAGEYDPVARDWSLTATTEKQPQSFRDGMLFGAMCYDPVNKQVICGQGRWAYADGQWRRLKLGGKLINGLRAKVQALRIRGRNLAGFCRARYYLAETPKESKERLDQYAAKLIRDISGLMSAMKRSAGSAGNYEKKQLAWAQEAAESAMASLKKAGPTLKDKVTVAAIHTLDAARAALERAVLSLAVAPPKRAHARMVYDPKNKKIVLFGGDTLAGFLADTWIYDPAVKRWEQRRPKLSPAPRAGFKLVYLPGKARVLLVDGYGYKSKGEMWSYDVKTNDWKLLAPASARKPSGGWFPTPAAAAPGGLVVTFMHESRSKLATYAARIDTAGTDAAGTSKRGVTALTEAPRPNFREDPQWYEKNAPPPDAAAEQKWFKELKPNTWTLRTAPNWPKIYYGISRCWGTSAMDSDRGQLLHFGGGHATWDGNDVLHYSIKANRFYIGHSPEHNLNFAPGGIGIPMCKSYRGRPFISCHTYRAYAYDPALGKMVFSGTKTEDKGFTYDPRAGDWDLTLKTPYQKNGFSLNHWRNKCLSTPKGVVVWTRSNQGLWRTDAAKGTWEKLALKGKVGVPGWDGQGMAYDSKRDRVLLLSSSFKGGIKACDLKTGEVKMLQPTGKAHGAGASREAVYIPELDGVLMGLRPAGKTDAKKRWLFYDCAKNAWLAVHLPGADPLGKRSFNVSLGLKYDPGTKLIWAMDILSKPYALRLDLKTADVLELGQAPERK